MLRRGGTKKNCAIFFFFGPASSQHYISGGGGGGGGGRNKTTVSLLRALATRTPILGRVGQGAWQLPQIRKCHFLSDPCVFWIYLLRKGAYMDFLDIILKHTQ